MGRQHLGVHLAYAGDTLPHALHAGYLAVIRRDAIQVPVDRLVVDRGRLRDGLLPITGADYLLIRLERVVERDDWESLSSIARPFAEALTALSHGNAVLADALARRALLEAFTSPDLTRSDRPRVASEIKRSYQTAKDAGLGLAPGHDTLASTMAAAPPAATLARIQPPTLDALLDLGA